MGRDRLLYHPETFVDAGLVAAAGDRKVCTKQNLQDAVAAPRGVASVRIVWILEELEEVACRVWEASRSS